MKEIFKGIFSFVLLTSCAQLACAQDALEVSSENIPSSLKTESSLKLTGEWDTYAFSQLKTALGTNAFGGNNTTLSKVDLSNAQIAENTSLYVTAGFTNNGVFMNCKALTEVVMPSAEEAAQFTSFQGAFQNCDKLTTIDLSGCTNVTSFNNAFYGCASLTQADLKNNIAATKTSSWTSAFEGCSALTQVSLPAGFAPTNKVFANCTALNEIDWSACNATETVPTYYAGLFEGVDVSGITLKLNHTQYLLFKADENWSQLNLVDLTPEPSTEYTVDASDIPSSLQKATVLTLTGEWDTYAFSQLKAALGTNAFGGNNTTLSKVDLSNAQIAENTSLYVTAGFTSNGAFMNCKALTEVVMPSAEETAQFTSFQGAFQNCDKLTTIDLSGCTNVTSFNNAFYGCASLTQADLKNNVGATKTSSWTSAFEGCSALTQVSLPAGFAPTNKVFANCTALNEIDWSACNATETVPTYYAGLFEGVDVSGITLKLNHAQYLLFKADESWSQLNLVDLNPEPSTEYTVDASDIPSSLQKATALTLTGEWDSDKFNLLSLALGNNGGILATPNTTLQTLDMSQITVVEGTPLYRKGLKEYGIFNNCTALTQVIMPSAEEAAKFTDLTLAFSGCSALKSIDLSQCSGITSLSKTFYNCSALTSVDLSACTMLTANDNAFENCEALTTVVLPASFPVGKNTFAYCNALKEIDWTSFNATEVPELSKTFFMGIDDLSLIKLSLKYEAYKLFSADTDWSELNLYNTEPEKVTDFVVDASDIPSSLSKAVTLTLTGEWDSDKLNMLSLALGNNGGLFEVYNKTLTLLDMSQITVTEGTPLSRQGINKEYGIFNNCTALTDVILPAAEETAKFTSLKKAFKGCTALVNIDLSLFTGATDMDEAFKNTAITTADMSGYTSVGTTVSAFEGCSALENVILPAGFEAGNYTFADCTGLQTIDFTSYTNTSEAPACSNNTFSGIDDLSLITLKVGSNSSVFEQHKIWSQFHLDGDDITGISQITNDGMNVKVYTVDGQYVGTYMMNECLTSKTLKPGIYIIQGKKYIKTR